jgi:3-oxoacyl-[acyl-carrier protein] reductase
MVVHLQTKFSTFGTIPDAGRVALVTGGQRGLGAATLREMAAEGATCVVNYPNQGEAQAARELVEDLESHGVSAMAIAADVTEPDQIDGMIAQIKQQFGRIDILVNNA